MAELRELHAELNPHCLEPPLCMLRSGGESIDEVNTCLLTVQDDRKEVVELQELHAKLTEREAALEAAAATQQQELQAAQVRVLGPLLSRSCLQWA